MKNMLAGLKSRPWTQRLGVRLASLIALSLLPLGLVAYLQTSNLMREAQGRTEEALMGESLRAASGEIRLISKAQGIVAGLAQAVPDVRDDLTRCRALMSKTLVDAPEIGLLAFVPKDGLMNCSSNGRTFDYSAIPLFQTIVTYRAPAFTMTSRGPVMGVSVMGVLHPVFDTRGDYLGYVSAWLPHEKLRVLQDASEESDVGAVQFWSFNRDGEVLTASMDLTAVTANLPANRPLTNFIGQKAQVLSAPSNAGVPTTYAVIPVVKDELYIMSSWVNETTAHRTSFYGIPPTWVPIMMWLAGLGTSIWAAEILVLRHVRALNRSISAFTGGQRRSPKLAFEAAPLELREMAEAYSKMTDDIMHHEAGLEDLLHQKEVLLREVHHRVKNNLQLIASIMNMQMRQTKTSEAKGLLKGVQDRIMSLATIHKSLYQTTGQSDIHANELLADITRQTMNMATGPGRRIHVTTDFDAIRLTPDQAVPLSLLLTEAMTNAIKYAKGREGSVPRLSVTMKRLPDQCAALELVNTVSDSPDVGDGTLYNTSTGLGAQLLRAFAQQIGGTLTQDHTAETYTLRVEFAIADLQAAEHRAANDPEESAE